MKLKKFFQFSILPLFAAGVAVGIWLSGASAPESSEVALRTCLSPSNSANICLAMPQVTGSNIEGEAISLPDALQGELNLVIMPFDRDQQVGAADWIPLFQTLSAERPDLAYYSIAALPDLAPPIRLLVTASMSAGLRDPEVRRASIVLFLEDQAAFIEALGLTDTETPQVFIVNRRGELLWQQTGIYDETAADALRAALEAAA